MLIDTIDVVPTATKIPSPDREVEPKVFLLPLAAIDDWAVKEEDAIAVLILLTVIED
jgi:hypothetical protein